MNICNKWLHIHPKMELYISVSSLYNFRLREKWWFKRLQNVNLSVCVYTCVWMLVCACTLTCTMSFQISSSSGHSVMSKSFGPHDCSPPGSPSMGFSRQEYWSEKKKKEYWSGLPFPSPGNFLNPGIEARSPALQTDSLRWELLGSPSFQNKPEWLHMKYKVLMFHKSQSLSSWSLIYSFMLSALAM